MQGSVTEFLRPRLVDIETLSTRRAKVTLEPLERGFGHTLGNALRRILLSSMPEPYYLQWKSIMCNGRDLLEPQANTVPSEVSAHTCSCPHAIAVKRGHLLPPPATPPPCAGQIRAAAAMGAWVRGRRG